MKRDKRGRFVAAPKRLPNGRFAPKLVPIAEALEGLAQFIPEAEPLPPIALELRDPALPALEPEPYDWAVMDEDPDDYPDDWDEEEAEQDYVEGCNCADCQRIRNMRHGVVPAHDPVEQPVVAAPKPKREPKPTKNYDMLMSDIPLREPAPYTLAKADRLMREYRDKAREATNVGQFLLVGRNRDNLTRLNEICHACLAHDLPGNKPEDEESKAKYNNKRYDYDYWNYEYERWEPFYLCKGQGIYGPPKPKREVYPYRYMVQYSNHAQKAQYHYDDTEPFEGERLEACRAYYDYLRNRSPWSRFFVGHTDVDTLTDYGVIIDLDAPSFVVHMAAVAWRMPGEYIELVESWYYLHKRGVDDTISFCMAMNHRGFDEDRVVNMRSSGHNLLQRVSWETMAYIVTGRVRIKNAEYDLKPARMYYSLYSDQHYGDRDANSWFTAISGDKSLTKTIQVPRRFGGGMQEQQVVPGSAFDHIYSLGWVRVLDKLSDTIVKKGW